MVGYKVSQFKTNQKLTGTQEKLPRLQTYLTQGQMDETEFKTDNSGIFLFDKCAELICARRKKEIILTECNESYINKPIFLCSDKVYGIVVLNSPSHIDRDQFTSRHKRHLITEEARESIWPDQEKFFAYGVRIKRIFKDPLEYVKDSECEIGFMDNIIFDVEKNLTERKIDFSKYYTELEELKTLEVKKGYESIRDTLLELYKLFVQLMEKRSGIILKPEPDITENYIRVRMRSPSSMTKDSFRTITLSASQGIKAVIGKLKSDPQGSMHVQSVLFQKDKWDVSRARKWIAEHKDSLKSMQYIKNEEGNYEKI